MLRCLPILGIYAVFADTCPWLIASNLVENALRLGWGDSS